jgi:hypothetical protein
MITTVMLAVLSLASCKQLEHERQIETVGELMDSLINRDEQVYRYIICGGDSTYQDERWFYYFYDEKNKNVQQSSLLFLADKTPDLLEKLCREAEKSYRYWEGDSLDYSITMHSKPLELLSFKSFKNKKDEEVVSLSHTTMKYAQHLSAPYDAQPIQAVLQKFLSEQKDVKTYDICYEWDEGVPFTDFKDEQLDLRYKGIGTDSLAAAKITGTLYIVTIKGEGRSDELSAELNKRMTALITERPIKGAYLSSFYSRGKWKFCRMQDIRIFDRQRRRKLYDLQVQVLGDKLYILELNSADAPRSAVPCNWWAVSRIHNDKVFWMNLSR